MYTEDEAKEKWCPQSITLVENEDTNRIVAINRMDGCYLPGTMCIGSECMWWVWDMSPGTVDKIKSKAEYSEDSNAEAHGHCGAIGAAK